jgi:hypothetical protein
MAKRTTTATTNPPTIFEAEAMDCARALAREFHINFDNDAGTVFSRYMLRQFALSHPFNLSSLMHDARQGWQMAHETIIELIAERNARSEALGSQLDNYNIDLLNPALPTRPRGPNKSTHVARNITVVAMVSVVSERYGLRPVRSRQSRSPVRRPSACAVVADALAAEGLGGMTERAVEKIWERFRGHVFRWEALTFESPN